jgi:hypothetical protein
VKLGEKQELFSQFLAHLILFAYANGYRIRIGEVERSKEQAEKNAETGAGIANSLHTIRLAADLHLFKNGVYLTENDDHLMLGEFWESLHELCRWGGRFGDGNHYSMEHNGVK